MQLPEICHLQNMKYMQEAVWPSFLGHWIWN